jgi:hypothetical protein
MPAVQGYLGDSLVRAKNVRHPPLRDDMSPAAVAEALTDARRALPRGMLRPRVEAAVRRRCIELVARLLASPAAGLPAQSFDIFGRQRRYIANNFLQHIESNDVVVPFCAWPLVSHYLFVSDHNLCDELYPAMFERLDPRLGSVPTRAGNRRAPSTVSRRAAAWAWLSARALMSPQSAGALNRRWLAPRIAAGPVRPEQFYLLRAMAAIQSQLAILAALTGDSDLRLGALLLD